MITHPAARTRALYAWEVHDLDKRRGVRPIKDELEGRDIVQFLWNGSRERPPVVVVRAVPNYSYCDGRSMIVLNKNNRFNTTVVHEVAHAQGFGSPTNPHTPAFVYAYVRLLSKYFGWQVGELQLQAIMRGLL